MQIDDRGQQQIARKINFARGSICDQAICQRQGLVHHVTIDQTLRARQAQRGDLRHYISFSKCCYLPQVKDL